jgi:EAL domain-containing protein (putative c-di-GMP-specific phosphodiesterase class I)
LAEGVETREQLEILLREGCDEFQGYLLGYPTAAVDGKANAELNPVLPARPVSSAA